MGLDVVPARARVRHDLPRRYAARLCALWAVSTVFRWLAALPVTDPRIFRDELLHWEMARAFALHQPFVLFGRPIDSPALLYPAVLSVVLHLANLRVAFDVARGLNAAMVSAVVFPSFGLALEFCPAPAALAVAALAALSPATVFSALIMEESLYYPLFAVSCWLCFRTLRDGSARDGIAAGLALCLTYFTKPLALLLVLAYAMAALAWGAGELWTSRGRWSRVGPILWRLAPLITFGCALLVRRALLAPAAGAASSSLLLGGLYAGESQGPLLPAPGPLAAVVIALVAALVLGTGVAPVASLLSRLKALREHDGGLFMAWAGLVSLLYVLAAARHSVVINGYPRVHERYVFAVAPLLLTVCFMAPALSLRRAAVAAMLAVVLLVIGPIADVVQMNPWDTPSLTLPMLTRHVLRSGLAAAVLFGALALVIVIAAARVRGRWWLTFACLAGLPLLLNLAWYASLYRDIYRNPHSRLNATWRLVHRLEERVGPNQRVTILIPEDNEMLQQLSARAEFWLDDRITAYWAGTGPAPWYTEARGPARDAVKRTAASYLIASPEFAAACRPAQRAPGFPSDTSLDLVVLEVWGKDCGAADE